MIEKMLAILKSDEGIRFGVSLKSQVYDEGTDARKIYDLAKSLIPEGNSLVEIGEILENEEVAQVIEGYENGRLLAGFVVASLLSGMFSQRDEIDDKYLELLGSELGGN